MQRQSRPSRAKSFNARDDRLKVVLLPFATLIFTQDRFMEDISEQW